MRNLPHQQPVEQPQPKSDHGVDEDLDGEDEEGEGEGEADTNERFFESLDRVPSGVSINHDIRSSTSDSDCDDARFSFASALAPPQPSPLSDSDDDDPAFDYGIWMSETVSIHERRRRLLQGFTSSNNIGGAGSLKLSRSRLSLRTTPVPRPTFSSHTRSRSDTDIVLHRSKEMVPLRRASSAPPSLRGHQRTPGGGREAAGGFMDSGNSLPDETVCRIKNLDTGKEFVVDGALGRLNDLQTGKQMTLEEFERCLGYSPIVKEVMRRVNLNATSEKRIDASVKISAPSSSRRRKSGSWLKNIKSAASSMTGLISDKDRDRDRDRDGGLGRTLAVGVSEWMRVRHHGKSHKELTGLYMCQQIQAHQGSIWCMKFSLDSLYLASAGEDRLVHVWQVSESSALMRHDTHSSLPPLPPGNGSPGRSTRMGISRTKQTRKSKVLSASKRSSVPDYVVMPETVFSLSEKPVCSFQGHLDDVLDLSWSKSQYLLSSSMDKTVRLWDMKSKSCLKLFAHNDFVTCIQFNPVDDRYFISGSLDAKVRIWSIPDRQVVDWTDLHEMVTAVCYTPDGQGAWVGSHKGICRVYNTSDCKLNQESQIHIWSKKRKSHAKKITGFQFVPGNPLEVMITSADSRVRVFDGVNMIHKFRGFRNTSSQISASFTVDGKYVMCPSEDSHVYLWKRNSSRKIGASGKSKGLITTRSHEHFYCKDVSVAIPWPNATTNYPPPPSGRYNQHGLDYPDSQDNFPSGRSDCLPLPMKSLPEHDVSPSSQEALRHPFRSTSAISSSGSFSSSLRSDATISSSSVSASSSSSNSSRGWYRGGSSSRSNNNNMSEAINAWGLVVVTAGLGGDIKIYQNFGLPLRLSRQTNLLF